MPPRNNERLAPHGGCNWRGCPECFPASPEDNGWSLYVWDDRRQQWMRQSEYENVSLEMALTTLLKWKSEGQTVRMDSVSGNL